MVYAALIGHCKEGLPKVCQACHSFRNLACYQESGNNFSFSKDLTDFLWMIKIILDVNKPHCFPGLFKKSRHRVRTMSIAPVVGSVADCCIATCKTRTLRQWFFSSKKFKFLELLKSFSSPICFQYLECLCVYQMAMHVSSFLVNTWSCKTKLRCEWCSSLEALGWSVIIGHLSRPIQNSDWFNMEGLACFWKITFISRTASRTSFDSTVEESLIFARASAILTMLSSCLGVAVITYKPIHTEH